MPNCRQILKYINNYIQSRQLVWLAFSTYYVPGMMLCSKNTVENKTKHKICFGTYHEQFLIPHRFLILSVHQKENWQWSNTNTFHFEETFAYGFKWKDEKILNSLDLIKACVSLMTIHASVSYHHCSSECHHFIGFQDHKQMFSVLYVTVTFSDLLYLFWVTCLWTTFRFIWNMEHMAVKGREAWQKHIPRYDDNHFIFHRSLMKHLNSYLEISNPQLYSHSDFWSTHYEESILLSTFHMLLHCHKHPLR